MYKLTARRSTSVTTNLRCLSMSALQHLPHISSISSSPLQTPPPSTPTTPAAAPTTCPAAPSAGGSDAELPRQRPSRVSLRKQSSVVHANLEENYDAVTASNHEALLQLLDQVGITEGEEWVGSVCVCVLVGGGGGVW